MKTYRQVQKCATCNFFAEDSKRELPRFTSKNHPEPLKETRKGKTKKFVFKGALAIYSPGRVARQDQGVSTLPSLVALLPELVVNSSPHWRLLQNLKPWRGVLARKPSIVRAHVGRRSARGETSPSLPKERFDDFERSSRIKSAESSVGIGRGGVWGGWLRDPRLPHTRDIKMYYTRWEGRNPRVRARKGKRTERYQYMYTTYTYTHTQTHMCARGVDGMCNLFALRCVEDRDSPLGPYPLLSPFILQAPLPHTRSRSRGPVL